MRLPEKPPRGPLVAGLVLAAIVFALLVVGYLAFASPGRGEYAAVSAAVAKSAPAAKKQRTPKTARKRRATGRDAGTLMTRTETVRPRVVVRGKGPIESVVRAGSPGVSRVTRDTASHEIVRSVVVTKAVPTVVMRSRSAGGKVVALTFDDGPHPTQTQQVLDILRAENIKATFFMVGRMARDHPEAARAVARAGMLIGDHTESHALLPGMTDVQSDEEIARGQESIKSVTGVTTRWFRSPYGAANSSMRLTASRLGMRVASWDVDASDWKNPSAKAISDAVVKHVRPGSIVLLHDGGGSNRANTVAALLTIIKTLKKQHYRFVTLDQL
jgi:peptidoglycan/xylan/chitin deacetylase (PgdA/CDA1 family)